MRRVKRVIVPKLHKDAPMPQEKHIGRRPPKTPRHAPRTVVYGVGGRVGKADRVVMTAAEEEYALEAEFGHDSDGDEDGVSCGAQSSTWSREDSDAWSCYSSDHEEDAIDLTFEEQCEVDREDVETAFIAELQTLDPKRRVAK